jgi:vacuolar-type H+-ATPase subunit E/Vma4
LSIDAARDALLADARAEAARLIAEADAEAREPVAAARRDADRLAERARAGGEAEGRVVAAHESAERAAAARREVLAARGEAYEELRVRARMAVLALRGEPGYGALLERLADAARRDLGAGAQLEVDPPEGGGVRGRAGSRRVDYTLPTLAERCVDALGPELGRLWV